MFVPLVPHAHRKVEQLKAAVQSFSAATAHGTAPSLAVTEMSILAASPLGRCCPHKHANHRAFPPPGRVARPLDAQNEELQLH